MKLCTMKESECLARQRRTYRCKLTFETKDLAHITWVSILVDR